MFNVNACILRAMQTALNANPLIKFALALACAVCIVTPIVAAAWGVLTVCGGFLAVRAVDLCDHCARGASGGVSSLGVRPASDERVIGWSSPCSLVNADGVVSWAEESRGACSWIESRSG
jgi:hypothetical protein